MISKSTLVIVGIAGAAFAGLSAVAQRVLTPRSVASTTIKVRSLGAPVTIIRDSAGVPHIYAASDRDALYALGFVHSQDRRLQMELFRRYARGEASAMTGEASLGSDRYMRTLELARHAATEVSLLSAEDRELHQAYADGVNAAAEKAGFPSGVIASMLRVKSEPWTVADSLLLLKLSNVSYSTQYQEELLTAALLQKVGSERLAWFLPGEPVERGVFLLNGPPAPDRRRKREADPASPHRRGKGARLYNFPYSDHLAQLRALRLPAGFGAGSNSWVVSGARSESGLPMLASDPHMSLSAPSGIYAAHVVSPGLEVIGAGIPGTPVFHHGHNRHIAWGVTVAGTDTQDLFLEEFSPTDANLVRTPDGWQPLSVRREYIEVRGRDEPVPHDVRSSTHGPLISDANPALMTSAVLPDTGAEGGKFALALSMTGVEAAKQGWYLQLARARNWDEFRQALRSYSGSGYNFLYADRDGHIGYQLVAQVPRRQGASSAVPAPGWQNSHQWTGELEFDSLPRLLDPGAGWIATANARVAGPEFPHYISARWGDLSWRVARIRNLILAKPKLAVDDMRAIQLDIFQQSMEQVVAWTREAAGDEAATREVRNLLAAWDLKADTESVAQTVAEAFRVELLREVFRPHLSDALLETYIAQPVLSSPGLEKVMNDPSAAFFGSDIEAARRARAAAVERAMSNAIRSLETKFGSDRGKWAWGRVHILTYRSPYAQGSGITAELLGRVFNVGPFEMPGSNTTINVAFWPISQWFEVGYGPGYRQIVDLADLARSIHLPPPPGQSESSSSPYFKNLAQHAVSGTYVPMRWTRDQVESDSSAVLALTP